MIPINKNIKKLEEYPFKRLNLLLGNLKYKNDSCIIDMSIGQPKHNQPDIINNILKSSNRWNAYPPTGGLDELKRSYVSWLLKRYSISEKLVDFKKNVLPLSGTREGLFSITLAISPSIVILPNPFYQVYLGGSIFANAKPIIINTSKKHGFLPELNKIESSIVSDSSLIYMCSPSNPQGASASMDYWIKLIEIVRKKNSILLVDECYSEIYTKKAPIGILEACKLAGHSVDNVLAFHSLSKRSNAAGLRSGFVVGDERIIEAFLKMRSYSAPTIPLPIQHASIELWNDEEHVRKNRDLYSIKFDYAEEILSKFEGFYRPDGGFYLWLKVGDGEETAKLIWKEYRIKVMPGKYLAIENENINPGKEYIRVALVDELKECKTSLDKIAEIIL